MLVFVQLNYWSFSFDIGSINKPNFLSFNTIQLCSSLCGRIAKVIPQKHECIPKFIIGFEFLKKSIGSLIDLNFYKIWKVIPFIKWKKYCSSIALFSRHEILFLILKRLLPQQGLSKYSRKISTSVNIDIIWIFIYLHSTSSNLNLDRRKVHSVEFQISAYEIFTNSKQSRNHRIKFSYINLWALHGKIYVHT